MLFVCLFAGKRLPVQSHKVGRGLRDRLQRDVQEELSGGPGSAEAVGRPEAALLLHGLAARQQTRSRSRTVCTPPLFSFFFFLFFCKPSLFRWDGRSGSRLFSPSWSKLDAIHNLPRSTWTDIFLIGSLRGEHDLLLLERRLPLFRTTGGKTALSALGSKKYYFGGWTAFQHSLHRPSSFIYFRVWMVKVPLFFFSLLSTLLVNSTLSTLQQGSLRNCKLHEYTELSSTSLYFYCALAFKRTSWSAVASIVFFLFVVFLE